MNDKKLRPLTAEETMWANRLKSIFLKKKDIQKGLTQDTLATTLGISQSAVGQYLNAKIPLNTDAKIAFSLALGCDTSEIDPKFAPYLPLSPEERSAAGTVRLLMAAKDSAGLQAFLEMADLLRKRHEANVQNPLLPGDPREAKDA